MLKKFLCLSIILLITATIFVNVAYATGFSVNLNRNEAVQTSEELTDNTIYTPNPDNLETENINIDESEEEIVSTTTTTDYEDETSLSITNIINIVLISVGVVLILLGIAIIIKLK